MANNVGRIGVALALDSAEFVRGIEAAGRKLGEFVQTAENMSRKGAMALTAMATAALAFADEVNDVSKANDIAIETILNLQKALATSGGSAENAGKLISSFTAFVDKAATGSDEAQKAFARAGISLRDLGKLSTEDLFKKAVAGIAAIEDPLSRNAKAMEVFGKAAKGVDFIDLNEGLQKSTALMKQQADGIKQAAEMWDKLKSNVLDFTAITASKLGPVLKETTEYLDKLLEKSNIVGDALKIVFQTVSVVGINVVYVLKTMFGEAEAMINYIKILSTQGLDAANKANDEYVKKTIRQREELDQAERRILGIGNRNEENDSRRLDKKAPIAFGRPVQESAESINRNNQALDESRLKVMKLMQGYEHLTELSYKSSMKQLDTEIKRLKAEEAIAAAYDQAFLSLQQSERLQNRQLDLDRESLLLNTQFKNLRAEEVKYAQDVMTIRAQYAEQEYQIKNVMNLRAEDETKALEANNTLRDKAIAQAKEALDITRQSREGTMADGFTKGFDEFVRDMPTRMELGKTAFNSLIGSMDSALRQFVMTGKFNFKDLVKSMIQELIYLESKAKMMDMFKSIKSGGGGDGTMGMLGGLFKGGGGGTPYMGVPSGMAMAEGGDPPVGMATLVGERGPEMFVPRTAGTIIPNNQLSGMGGGQTINYNGPYIASMNAIDTQSGTQFLAKNKNTIWAAYQSANRGVPVSR
jgi:lambda family phage tail tape measure protein